MTIDIKFALIALGMFFLTALATGVWKYRWMLRDASHQAPTYVDVAHKAALHYSFAIVIVLEFMRYGAFAPWVNLLAAIALIGFFVIATGTYIALGISNHTDNQFRERNLTTTWGMAALIAAEFAGFLVLFAGVIVAMI